MLRTMSMSSHLRVRAALSLRSLPQTLTYLPQQLFLLYSDIPLKIIPPSALISTQTISSPLSHASVALLQRHDDDYKREHPTPTPNGAPTPRLFVVQPRLRPEPILQVKLDEALNLANSLQERRDHGFFDTELWEKEVPPPHVLVQNPASRSLRTDTYFGPGTVETIKCHLNAIDSKGGVDAVFVNAILTGIQQRNLERVWGKPVLDRMGLIIEIFNAHAYTKEAKLQAELAALMYKRSRLVRLRGPDGRHTFGAFGEAEVVSARGRGSGGCGFISGAGETELQLQRRRILERRNQLLSEINEVRRTRALQRAARKRYGDENSQVMATVAVVGYTNAGKSTLVSTLSNSDLYSDDRLFATVDPKLRSVILPSGRKVLFSDTVGFISDLPVQLVEAFHATLEEVVEADLLVHVLDSSASNLDDHRETVLQVLKQIGVSEDKLQNMIEVWNKIDLQEEIGDDECLDDGSFSGADDNDLASEQSSGDPVDDCDDNNEDIVSELSSGYHEETPNDQQSMLCEDWREIEKNSPSQSRSVPHVKTSSIMGVGLQELLKLIDAKLKSQNIVERNIFDRKWRPPRTEDAGIAVEQ